MPDEALRQFYALAGKPLIEIYEWRRARLVNDQHKASDAALRLLAELSDDWWQERFSAAKSYSEREDEWQLVYGVWNHSGHPGPGPEGPEWPAVIPEFIEAMSIIRCFKTLHGLASDEWDRHMAEDGFLSGMLGGIILNLDSLRRLLDAPEEDHSDGPIDRNELATMLGIKPKTLANRATELPEPIARNAKGVPIYMYRAARHDLLKIYPDKAFMLPDYAEIN